LGGIEVRLRKKKKRIVVIIDEHGMVLAETIRCPKCNRKVVFINKTTTRCKKCGTWDIKDLIISSLPIKYTRLLGFIESN